MFLCRYENYAELLYSFDARFFAGQVSGCTLAGSCSRKTTAVAAKQTPDIRIVVGAIAAAAGVTAGITALVAHGRCQKIMKTAQNIAQDASRRMSEAQELERTANAAKKGVQDKIDAVQKAADEQIKAAQEKTNNFIKDITSGKTLDESAEIALRKQTDNFKLDYDPAKPPINESTFEKTGMEFADFKPTNARPDMMPLDIPKYKPGEKWFLELPSSADVKPSRLERIDFKPHSKVTNLSENYANSVNWDNNKIARDLLQNFYDGHGQTLDGVKFAMTPLENGKIKVRIEGKGIYSPDKAIGIGETTKANDANAAGNFGEGLKVTVLKLLKDKGAQKVDIASDGWKLTYDVAADANLGTDKKFLRYSLDTAPQHFDGNYIEFETNSTDLVKSVRNSINHFYHSGNVDFKKVDFENGFFGIKILPEGEKGRVYMSGQRFEFEETGQWEGLKGYNLFFKQKPPAKADMVMTDEVIYAKDRDRTALTKEDFKKIMSYFVSQSDEKDTLNALRSLEKSWSITKMGKNSDVVKVLEGIAQGAYCKHVKIKFPDNFIAHSNASDSLVADLVDKGYTICPDIFGRIGMKTIAEHMDEVRAHNTYLPDANETKKIVIIKAALEKLKPHLSDEFDVEELNPKIYLFDAKSSKEKDYADCLAEAITRFDWNKGKKETLGFWIDKKYLNKSDLFDALGTALHELSHKIGGDGNSDFSYKLTTVLEKAMRALVKANPADAAEIRAMDKIWSELTTT
jgi:hypothetical protein